MKMDPDTENARTLVYFPVIHTDADMGALGGAVREMTVKKLGKEGWEKNISAIDKIWTTIEKATDELELPRDKARIYQDGLPVCGRELEIVTELARSGNRNHQLLLRLIGKGAVIMGTESPEFLVEEYQLVRQLLAAGDTEKLAALQAQQKTRSRCLLEKRDRFIAKRINDTLGCGETGILFIGMLHSISDHLEKDIRILYPLGRYNIVESVP